MMDDLISRSALWTDIMMLPHNGDIISSEEVEQAIVEAPAVDAVPVERLGKIGKLFLPYKGCSRGHVGRMGAPATLEEEALFWGVITDVDGGRWVPVVEAVLLELIEKAKANDPESLRPKGRWIDTGESYEDEHCRYNYWACSVCENRIAGRYGLHNYCPNCGADMRERTGVEMSENSCY